MVWSRFHRIHFLLSSCLPLSPVVWTHSVQFYSVTFISRPFSVMQVEFVHDQKPYEDLISNSTLATLFEANAASLGVDICSDPVVTQRFGGSTDMGNVSHVVPSLQPKFYIGTTAGIHSTEYTAAAGTYLHD